MTGKGHNSVDGAKLKSFVERIEKLTAEKQALGEDIREVFTEVKSAGYDAKIVRQVIRARQMDKTERDELQELFDLYMGVVGA